MASLVDFAARALIIRTLATRLDWGERVSTSIHDTRAQLNFQISFKLFKLNDAATCQNKSEGVTRLCLFNLHRSPSCLSARSSIIVHTIPIGIRFEAKQMVVRKQSELARNRPSNSSSL